MREELRDRVARGVAWSLAEKAGSMLLQMGVSILVARMLAPEDYGVMALLTVFATLSLVVVDSGFSQTLIRSREPSPSDYRSVFRFNLTVATLLYGVMVALSPLLAAFFDQPVLTRIAPVLFLLLPLNALCVIQQAIYTRRFRFDTLSKVVFASSAVSGGVAVAMAWSGCGVWSLVAQRLAAMGVKAALLWMLSDWRPAGRYDGRALRAMAPYSLRLLATDLISTLYNNISQLFVGKMYSAEMLGFFNQGQKLKDLPVTATIQSVQNVSFPALSKIREDSGKFAEGYRQLLLMVAFVVSPVMLGMVAVAEELFALFLGEKWMPTVPYFEILSLSGLFMPLAMVACNVLKARSDGSVIVRLEVVKKTVQTLILAVSIPCGVRAIAWGVVAMAFCELALNLRAARRFAELSFGRIARAIVPAVLLSVAMFAAVRLYGDVVTLALPLLLLTKILLGAVLYIGLSLAFRLEAAQVALGMLRRMRERS
ncbi:lipopolysaccharide biosynthesis protein [uncultured Alistipes sp.]|mgnify:FL=1|uniref:lipopolysaccharide biosynthesis protein n=1 Tax=uncultured Alistipes sp. TaxID=538949 RepID=UPI0025F7EED6|nr:lipopolysaccharide biosynthesis protein [uncultured Alistipes sp.]